MGLTTRVAKEACEDEEEGGGRRREARRGGTRALPTTSGKVALDVGVPLGSAAHDAGVGAVGVFSYARRRGNAEAVHPLLGSHQRLQAASRW